MAENKSFSSREEVNDLRKELDAKIDKKVSDKTFSTIVIIAASAIGTIFVWLMTMNIKIACLETKIEMTQPVSMQQNNPIQSTPQNAVKK
ncbi:MAG: hypothetical protein WDL87_01235 [Candidatus Omnitrophota bacterium]|jgi:hypothetical protein